MYVLLELTNALIVIINEICSFYYASIDFLICLFWHMLSNFISVYCLFVIGIFYIFLLNCVYIYIFNYISVL